MIIDKSQKVFTIPNVLSLFRLALLPLFVYVYFKATTKEDYFAATIIFFISAVSDSLDGFIARKFNMITELGKFLDPLADKLTQITILFCLGSKFRFMLGIALICVVKDLFMGIMGIVMLKLKSSKLNGAKWFGKISTAFTYVVILLLLLFPKINVFYADILIVGCGVLMLLSLILYIKLFRKMWQEVE